MNLNKVGIRHSPLSDSIYLCRFGKDPSVALDKRNIESEVMRAITEHMMLDAPRGAKKKYCIGKRWYEIQIKPVSLNNESS